MPLKKRLRNIKICYFRKNHIPFHKKHTIELIILKRLYIYIRAQQISKYTVDNECQVSHCQRKKLPCGIGLEPKISV